MSKRMRQYQLRRDTSEKPIRDALRECGLRVLILAAPGVPDLAVYNPVYKRWFMIDAKTKKVKKTEKQTWDEDLGEGAVAFCTTIEQALDACQVGVIKRSSVGKLDVVTSRRLADYVTVVNDPDSKYGIIYSATAPGYEAAKLTHDRVCVSARNYKDYGTPFDQAFPLPFEALHPADADEVSF